MPKSRQAFRTPTAGAQRTIEIESTARRRSGRRSTVAISPNGQIVAAGCDDHRIRLWNIADGSTIAQLREHTDWVRGIRSIRKGRSSSPSARLLRAPWDLETNASCSATCLDGRAARSRVPARR